MNARHDYIIFGLDSDGEEVKLTVLLAASEGHAKAKARMYGYKNVTRAEWTLPGPESEDYVDPKTHKEK